MVGSADNLLNSSSPTAGGSWSPNTRFSRSSTFPGTHSHIHPSRTISEPGRPTIKRANTLGMSLVGRLCFHLRLYVCLSARHVKNIVLKAHYHSGNFVKCDWLTQIFRGKKNFEVKNFQLLTMIFSGNFLSVEIFLE